MLAVGMADALADSLRSSFDVDRYSRSATALDALSEGGVDGVLSAHDLPDSDSLAFLEAVRAKCPALPFVVVTDEGSERLAGELIDAGVTAYVPATADGDLLRDRLQRACETESAAGVEVVERYRRLVETSPVAINLFDGDGTTLYGNDAVLDLLGLEDRDELVGSSIYEYVHPDDRGVARRELRSVIEEKRSIGPTRMDLVRPDGEVRHVQVATAPGRYEGTDVGQAVAIDVTPLRETQRELEAERQFIDDALDALPDIFFYVSPDGTLERWNETVERLGWYDASELSTKRIDDLFVEEDRRAVYQAFETVLEEGEATVEARIRTGDGRAIPHEFRGRRLGDKTGDDVGVVGIGRDVSARKARDRQLRIIDRVLRHTLRNALTTMGGRAEIIREATDGELADSADAIVRTADDLLETADKERTVVHLLSERPEPTPLDVANAVRTVVDAMAARHPDAAIEMDVPDELQALAIPELSRAVLELVDNAIRHQDSRSPVVEVVVERTERTVRLAVRDEGPPIPEVEIAAMDGASDPDDQLVHGSGIGLWLVELVVALSGGTLAFDDNDGDGNVVAIALQPDLEDVEDRDRVETPLGEGRQE